MTSWQRLVFVSLCAFLIAAAPAARAAERPAGAGAPATIHLTLTLTQQAAGKAPVQSVYELVGAAGETSKFVAGMRLPLAVPPVAQPSGDAKTTVVSSFTYQNAGVNIEYKAKVLEGGQIQLDVRFSASEVFGGARNADPSAQPVTQTIDHQVTVDLAPGVQTPLYKVQLPEGSFSLTVVARVAN